MKFQLEKAQDVFQEMLPLLRQHWEEISHYKDIALEPDVEAYFSLQLTGSLRVFTARTSENELVGYAVYFIRNHLHYKSCRMAYQDILFIRRDVRGLGGSFIFWCDDQLKNEGVQVVAQHIKAAHNFGPLLEKVGYTLMDLIYVRRLDTPQGG